MKMCHTLLFYLRQQSMIHLGILVHSVGETWPQLEVLIRLVETVRKCKWLACRVTQVLESQPQPRWQLTDHQWEKVRSSAYFRDHPAAKLLPPLAITQTLQSSYKRGYMIYSQACAAHP